MPLTFDIEQAKELVPWLQRTFDLMQPLIVELDDLARDLELSSRELSSDGGGEAEKESREAQKAHQEIEGKVRELVDSIVEKGILIKDPRRGLFDFPHEMEGDLVNLCWLSGEPGINYWHTLDSGFAGRQRL
jgi:hypothetical protein